MAQNWGAPEIHTSAFAGNKFLVRGISSWLHIQRRIDWNVTQEFLDYAAAEDVWGIDEIIKDAQPSYFSVFDPTLINRGSGKICFDEWLEEEPIWCESSNCDGCHTSDGKWLTSEEDIPEELVNLQEELESMGTKIWIPEGLNLSWWLSLDDDEKRGVIGIPGFLAPNEHSSRSRKSKPGIQSLDSYEQGRVRWTTLVAASDKQQAADEAIKLIRKLSDIPRPWFPEKSELKHMKTCIYEVLDAEANHEIIVAKCRATKLVNVNESDQQAVRRWIRVFRPKFEDLGFGSTWTFSSAEPLDVTSISRIDNQFVWTVNWNEGRNVSPGFQHGEDTEGWFSSEKAWGEDLSKDLQFFNVIVDGECSCIIDQKDNCAECSGIGCDECENIEVIEDCVICNGSGTISVNIIDLVQ